MPETQTTRHNLPLLAVAQAQKEITHNEALVRIDALLHPVVQAELSVPPVPGDADIGKCWLVAASPTGEWAGKAAQIAIWIGGGWRFCAPVEGMRARVQSQNADRIRSGGAWITPPSIPNPASGSVVDAEARTAIVTLLAHLRAIGHVTG
jgi:Protein of unknown function (DUF2793)